MNDELTRPLISVSDEELDRRWESIMHSLIQAAGGIGYWNTELTQIRQERKARKKAEQQVVREGQAVKS